MLTEQEKVVITLLVDTWNEYLKLPVEHNMAQTEFCSTIHNLMNHIAARPTYRKLNATT